MVRAVAVALFATACSGSDPSPEVVVTDASLGATPHVIGASSSSVFWTAGSMPTLVGGAPITQLPATGSQLASAAGPIAMAGDLVIYADSGRVLSVDAAGTRGAVSSAMPEAVGGNASSAVFVWTVADTVSWTIHDTQVNAMLTKIDHCDHVKVTNTQIYVAADSSGGRRFVRLDQQLGTVTLLSVASKLAAAFPGGGMAGATYTGRIVDADDDGVLFLVEEMPSRRAILVREPMQGDPAVVLDHVMNASGFFASPTDLYWQEGNELLTAPRAGGSASIITSLPGEAGALADGYIYYVHGMAIERLRVE
jgi:hypothetical protein